MCRFRQTYTAWLNFPWIRYKRQPWRWHITPQDHIIVFYNAFFLFDSLRMRVWWRPNACMVATIRAFTRGQTMRYFQLFTFPCSFVSKSRFGFNRLSLFSPNCRIVCTPKWGLNTKRTTTLPLCLNAHLMLWFSLLLYVITLPKSLPKYGEEFIICGFNFYNP